VRVKERMLFGSCMTVKNIKNRKKTYEDCFNFRTGASQAPPKTADDVGALTPSGSYATHFFRYYLDSLARISEILGFWTF